MTSQFADPGNIQQLHSIIKKLDSKRIFIVSGKNSYEMSGAKDKLEAILDSTESLRYFDFEENPKFKDALKGKKIIREFNPDLILAIGGGSVIDTAKILSVLPDDEAEAEKMVRGETEASDKLAPMIAVPTTSGAGSEATHFAVVYIDDVKYSLASDLLKPEYVVLEPELTYSMTPIQTAISGIDAFCQSIESFWAIGATDESRTYGSDAIQIILKNLEGAVSNPDSANREEMMTGAHLAGKAINISKTTAPHALSYSLTTNYGIPHGHAVALTMGEFILFNSRKADTQLNDIMEDLFALLGCNNAHQCRDKFLSVMTNIGLKTKLSEVAGSFGKSEIPHLVNSVNEERLGNHPVKVTKSDISKILGRIA
jgi:alcohol dehydrogenase class IV